MSPIGNIYRASATLASPHVLRGLTSAFSRVTISPRPTQLCLPSNSVFDQRRHYAMRLELTEHGIVWRRPEYIPSWTPPKSGDLRPYAEPDPSRPPLKVLPAKDAFENLDEETKRFLSLELATREETLKIGRLDALRKVQKHKYDTGSMEATITMLTCKIRNLQEVLLKNKKDKPARCRLIELIARRKKLMKHLRRMDYKRFEWLLETLNLEYKPFPTAYHWITRKDSLRKLVQLHKEDIRTKRLEEYREVLKSKEESFLKEKAETLEWIAKTEAELKIPIGKKYIAS
ncbi:small ribosomal subunit protein uS15m isoform X1 [Macrobrachium rosenbergii]|uniref:small ribosomal subunit protein uS15m isoform X1 n=1 Tax=Macrobrachium rosenbergii TaxID=79674 RepID=UPI0034D3D867